ncbi:MAG TPA: response regulator transcription factor [Patescibacteria group bacterium]|nr:response regulator transcription factor [Patescibacteria group bacterium]
MRGSILFVEDEEALRLTVGDRLRSVGYAVDCAVDGVEALEKATLLPFDLILLDVMLPRKNGFVVCRDIRRAGLIVPILMLTARSQTADKVKGLRTGADDYLVKPFDMAELIARLEALLRRAPNKTTSQAGVFKFGSCCVDLMGTQTTRDGKPMALSAREFQLLRYFIGQPGATLSREELLKQVWGYTANVFTRTVDVHVASLRQKVEDDPKQPKFILTVQGLGYKFKP